MAGEADSRTHEDFLTLGHHGSGDTVREIHVGSSRGGSGFGSGLLSLVGRGSTVPTTASSHGDDEQD
jgi:hypothetical protein